MITNQTLIEFFLDWMDNYLTSGKMAEDLNLDRDDVQTLVHMGRKYLNRQHEGQPKQKAAFRTTEPNEGNYDAQI